MHILAMIEITAYVSILFVCCCLDVSVEGDECPYKECICTGDVIMCTDRELKSLPQRMTKKNRFSPSLHLENNEISTIPAERLPSTLTDIYLLNNPILTIDDAAFDESSKTLETVSFSNVRFTQIPNAFLHVNNLLRFAISDSSIVDWNINVMKHIGPTTNILYLDNVGLTSWPTWIQYFSKLTELTIVDSSIADIPEDGLLSLASCLRSVSMYNNALTSVPKALIHLKVLEMLYLQGNQIADVTWLSHASKLLSLSLSNNRLSDARNLSQALRQFADTLSEVDLHQNVLTQIPELGFLQGVDRLDLSYNNIYDPNSGSFPPSLFYLDLDNNNLPSFPRGVASLLSVTTFIVNTNSIRELQGVDFPPATKDVVLAYNLISQISDISFPHNSTIITLNLNDNPIVRISSLAFNNLPHLTVLYLRRTKLTRLPLGLVSLKSLNTLDISDTFGLVCTCDEKSLAPLIISMTSVNVKGRCGLTDIYTFFNTFSPSCP